MKIFVSGATGFIGSRLSLRLANDGHQVHALYRNESKVFVIQHQNIKLFKGDIFDYNSLILAIEGCEQIYHIAAFAKVWEKDPSSIYRLNIEGTMNVVRAGINSSVKKIVCTSTAGVLGPSIKGKSSDENTPRPLKYFIDYECSKAIMEETLKVIPSDVIEIVVVNPTRVYGPGVLSESNAVTRIMQHFIHGNWRIIPGDGNSIGNYVYIEDVVTGHILAMEKGKHGERYLLGGTNMSYNEFFNELSGLSDKKYFMTHIPISIIKIVAWIILLIARISGGAPFITPSLIRKYNYSWRISSAKAERELNYHPFDFKNGAGLTLNWLKSMK